MERGRAVARWSGGALVALLSTAAMGARSVPAGAERVEFSFTSSHDGSEQMATALVPKACRHRADNPLLVLAHHMGGDRHSQGYYDAQIEAREWLLVVPDLHGSRTDGRFCWAALEAQHDLVDAVAYMRQHYGVDSTRIYLAGRSMGGTLAAVTAAKYPDLFAAAVAGQGVYDWGSWRARRETVELSPEAQARLAGMDSLGTVEMGGPYSARTRWAYERHSAVSYAPNFGYVPLILWHGALDERVPPDQSSRLAAAIREYDPYHPDPHWLRGAPHTPMNFPPEWILDQLQYYRNVGDSGWGRRFYREMELVTDEAKGFFWVHITPGEGESLTRTKVSLTGGVLSVQSETAAAVRVQLGRIPPEVRFQTWQVESGRALSLSVARGEEVLFEAEVRGRKQGSLPDLWKPFSVGLPAADE